MATIVWGSWVQDRFRCGIETIQSPSSVGSGTSSVNVTVKVYIQTRYWGNDSGVQWTISGGVSGSGTTPFDHSNDLEYTFLGQATDVVNTVYGSTVTVNYSGSVTGWVAYSGTATVSKSHTVGARPYSTPSTVSNVVVARASDTQQNITWIRNSTAAAPYANQYVERWDNVGLKYALIATLSGTATSYNNTNTIANRQYRYRVRAKNPSGVYSSYTYSNYIKTTPSAPSTPVAVKDSSGNIVLSWSTVSAIGENIEVWHAANGVWDGAALTTIGNVTTYTHVAPNASVTHAYRLRTKVTGPSLTSAYSGTSNTVQLLAPPNAPTNLSPTGVTLDATQDILFSWQHNPVDTTPQTYRETRYRVNGGAWVQPGRFASSVANRTYTAGTFTNGTTVEWQVRTWGAATTGGSLGNGDSPWSATGVITLSSPPAATINYPDGSTHSTSTITVDWGYFDAEGTAQTQWTVKLYDNLGNLLETKSQNNNATSIALDTTLKDGKTYTVTLQVRDTAGSWSSIESQAFLVVYAPPPVPQASPSWDEESGATSIEALVGTPIARSNAIANGSVETNLTGWTGGTSSVVTRVEDEHYHGAWSIQVDCPVINGYLQYLTKPTVAAGQTWTLSAMVKGQAGESVKVEARGQSSTDVTTNTVVQTFLMTGEWQQVFVTATWAANTVKFWPLFFGLVAGQTFWVDAVLAEQIDEPLPYMEGSYTEVATASMRVWRSEDAGETWALVATDVVPGSSVVDYVPPLNSTVSYRVDAVSATPSVASSQPVEVFTDSRTYNRIWLNVGPSFSRGVFLSADGKVGLSGDRTVELVEYSGREKAVEYSSAQTSEFINVSGTMARESIQADEPIIATSSLREWRDAIKNYTAPKCLRDLRGNRWFVSASNFDIDDTSKLLPTFSFAAKEVDWVEPDSIGEQ